MTEQEHPIFTEGEPILGNRQEELRQLRLKQLNSELTEDDERRFKELQDLESQTRDERDAA